ncbi:cardiac ankyrin repeat-containing protein [Legionella nautarum]|uniref:Cardiac ankyrin repeat-containing protein n=1 Tax=Legionella nautarum TaxID=45070 RepID=A0A0W0WKJ3_9GAMM|nr:Dot/Icm T4SS effector AnkK/LegA5 [Legionella nautarum]KTD32850.1 cardiac ankyrin repeat-containing protein [Legionella nautarum]
MSFFYKSNRIIPGEPTRAGHTFFKEAKYLDLEGFLRKIVYKKNKKGNPQLSVFEVAFTALARRFLRPDLTPKQALVKNQGQEIVGLASEYFSYTAQRREGLGVFASIAKDDRPKPARDSQANNLKRPSTQYCITYRTVSEPEQIPIAFLDQYDPGFFNVLWQLRSTGQIDFDVASLASVLAGSYSLEEDDLHKGNLGFYIVKKLIKGEEKFQVVFFKIDNDLMLVDSMMSRCNARMTSWLHNEHAFEITMRDLIDFPNLSDSKNFYWPTYLRLFANPIGNKDYSDEDDALAFIELGKDPEFQREKWREFYKHILIPQAIIEQDLEEVLDKNSPEDRAQIALITHAVLARQAKLRAVLFAIPQFRDFVMTLKERDAQSIQDEIVRDIDPSIQENIIPDIDRNMEHYNSFCANEYVDGDTPLHLAIRLGDYRYQETWQSFSEFAAQENSRGEKPLDVAVAAIKNSDPHSHNEVRKNPFLIIQALLKEGVQKTASYKELSKELRRKIKNYSLNSIHRTHATEASSTDELLALMQAIGEDHSFSLKMKKELSVICLKDYIRAHRNDSNYEKTLLEIKEALNGYKKPPAPQLQFIRQLRSHLWIIRKIRGLFGVTSTQSELNGLINQELNRLNPSCFFSCFSFFFCNSETDIGAETVILNSQEEMPPFISLI